ncbi:MAG: hypothetical protein JJLCMIEE_02645 [Acidimicrobiales bacterium]|nr:MAG: antibiotic biosynthesis monooxygenase [Actinomycetota bacterium]MBV6509551.1 hypothetical protein [Acidimicrobiales bacterium]RIK06585.1 MAG: hypothetical protein DCC48_06640 [Acidobacteriota bacterium]
MSKTAVIAKIVAAPGRRDEAVSVLEKLFSAVSEEPGTEQYILHTDTRDEDTIWMYELYTDDEALAVHSSSETMAIVFGEIGPLLGAAPELIVLEAKRAKATDV